MSEERQETIDDIVKEIRGNAEHNHALVEASKYLTEIADRIEKAADATYREKLYEYAILWDYDNSLFVKSIDYSYIKQKMDEVNEDGPVCHLVRREVGEWEELPFRTENDARKNGGTRR